MREFLGLPWAGAFPPFAVLLAALSACTADKGDGSNEDSGGVVVDVDGDGYGAEADCDDASAAISPGAPEVCNGIDDDCDGLADEPGVSDGTMYYPDADGDGYGDAGAGYTACEQPEGTLTDGSDCDDANAARSPAAAEVCDGLDNDCDSETDEPGATDGLSAHVDADGDGYGDPGTSEIVCAFDEGHVANDDDCDDDDPDVKPGANELCDEVDNDCDGTADNDAQDADTYYLDEDGDGYGVEESTALGCDTPDGYAARAGDCNDDNRRVYPRADETCNDIDDDCDGEIDNDPVDTPTYYYDTDSDTYGADETGVTQCDDPGDGWVTRGGDCDEEDASVNPGVDETWYDGLDQDCDERSDYDQDGDGYVISDLDDEDAPTLDPGTGEVVDDGSETEGGDCDDEDRRVNPDARERCNDLDDDCSGEIDDDAYDARTYYVDEDGDGYGDEATALTTCDEPEEGDYIFDGGDCDDSDADISPDAEEGCDDTDGVDNDCDGVADEVCYEGSLNYQQGFGSDPDDRDCDLWWSSTWTLTTAEECPDCDYTFTVEMAYDAASSTGARRCDWSGEDFTWLLGLDEDYYGEGYAVMWYGVREDYYYYYYDDEPGYDDDYDYDAGGGYSGGSDGDAADVSPPPPALYWFPLFHADWEASTGALSFYYGYYEYPYSEGRETYYYTQWFYGTADLAGIGG